MDEQERRLEMSKQNQDYGKDNCENIALHYAKKCETYEQRIKELEAVYDHPNHDDPKQRYLYEIRCAIKLLREKGSEYAFGVAVQLDQFYKRARKALA